MRARCIAVLGLLLATSAGAGDEVGFVRLYDDRSEINHGGVWAPIKQDFHPVLIGDGLRTQDVGGGKAGMRVKFEDLSLLDLKGNTELEISNRSESDAEIRLRQGSIHIVAKRGGGTACHMKTDEAVIECTGTELLVLRNAADETTTVIVVDGAVAVQNVAGIGDTVTVRSRQTSTVRPGEPPTIPHRLDDDTIESHLQTFRFIGGGRAVSLANGSGLLGGGIVPTEAQAPAAPPVTTPGDSEFEPPDPGEVQPPFALQRGQLDLPF